MLEIGIGDGVRQHAGIGADGLGQFAQGAALKTKKGFAVFVSDFTNAAWFGLDPVEGPTPTPASTVLSDFQSAVRSRYSEGDWLTVVQPINDARELKWVAEHDPVVAAHYRGFDYDHARVVRLVLARTVYVSYRIGNQVYWTRHRVTLKKGEKLITDGRMTARARCANRVEEIPQQATNLAEPPPAKLDQPSLGAADWLGFTQETSIQLPAYAQPASHPPAANSASVKASSSTRLACPLMWLFIVSSIP